MKKIILILCFSAACLPTYAGENPIKQWTSELSPKFSIRRDFGKTATNFDGTYGIFVTDYIKPEVGLGLLFSENLDAQAFGLGVSFYGNDDEAEAIPFIGIAEGVVSTNVKQGTTKSDRTTLLVTAPHIGLLIPINKNIAVDVEFIYERWSGDKAGVGATNHWRIPLGFSVFF